MMPELSLKEPASILSEHSSQGISSQDESVVPTFTFRKPSTCDNANNEHETLSLIMKGDGGKGIVQSPGFCLQVCSADVCRICQCGPNTLATPTPLLLTPITSPKKRFSSPDSPPPEPSTSNLTSVTIELKRQTSSSPASTQASTPLHHNQAPEKKKLTPDYNLISPCVCSGTLKYVHQCCLQSWIRASNNTNCELCKHPFQLRSKFKPLWKWESLPMQPGDKKRIVCSAMFHTVALACVVWSLYVLIDRTIEELTHSDLEWQFWTKIIVEAIGCLGAGILTYVWGKTYVSLFIKWITFNRSFVIIGKDEHVTPLQTGLQNPHNNQQQELINLIG